MLIKTYEFLEKYSTSDYYRKHTNNKYNHLSLVFRSFIEQFDRKNWFH